ncbi:MAG: tetratricopeptide repeat protein [Lachnospiraceae bacterium]|nr:tetratricopeptide repeat protein [Lachnospiraceae bacterium]
MNTKRARLIMAVATAIVIVIAIIMGVYYGVSNSSPANKMADLLVTANKYMDSGDYEKAISYFDDALNYEPESEEIRNAISYAYIKLAENSTDSVQTVDYYQKSLLYNKTNKTPYWGIANVYESLDDEDNMLASLQNGYDNTGDETMRQKIEAVEEERARIQAEEEAKAAEEAERAAIEQEHAETLQKLYDCFEGGDLDAVKEMMRTEEFTDFADEVIGDNSFYFGTKTPEGVREGKGIAVYRDGYYYYGDFSNDQRNGHGILMRAVYSESSAIGSFVYDGEWSSDKPNGEGTSTSNYYKDKVGPAGLSRQVIKGNYTDGLENGTMRLDGTPQSGGSVSYSYTAENGVAKKISDEDSGVKGQYIIAKSSDGKSNLTSDGSLRGVEGFTGE